ncbi:alpha/beta fold hydrolase [Nonomuraea insulae]|uniref:Alpha/beta fold hydrolase n=1 Tax=Nonomuraea insulae TaxID=1616787 RepID=A0ABW1CVG2_9ACTN
MRLWTERFGGSGDPVVLLVMGTSTPGLGWPDELVETLVAGGRQVIRFDHRDTGRSDCVDFATHPYTVDDMAGDAVAVLDAYDIATTCPRPRRVSCGTSCARPRTTWRPGGC